MNKTTTNTHMGADYKYWKIDQTIGINMKPIYLIETQGGDAIARTEHKSIAALFISAPELLEACKICLEYLETQSHPRNLKEQIAFKEHQKELLKNVILKATGENV